MRRPILPGQFEFYDLRAGAGEARDVAARSRRRRGATGRAASQSLAERLLGNQIEETVHLARSAREAGAAAASAFGAGFGGSVWALVADGAADGFVERWRADYAARFPAHAGAALFFRSDAGPPALRLL